MEFRLLEYFLAVAREQNITAAAESLHISQPALSTQLKAMEMELGKQLLIRGVRVPESRIDGRRNDPSQTGRRNAFTDAAYRRRNHPLW